MSNKQGTKTKSAKEGIKDIKWLLANGSMLDPIAKKYGLSILAIKHIKQGKIR